MTPFPPMAWRAPVRRPPSAAPRGSRPDRRRPSSVPLLLIGAVAGLAWAASLRGFMVEVAGPGSTVTWAGTFGGVLLPGVVAGVLLARSEQLRRRGRPGRRWLIAAPLTFVGVLLPGLLDPATLFRDGVGAGAVAVPLYGIVGGLALSGRVPQAVRIVCAVGFLTVVPGWALTVVSFAGPAAGVDTPRGLWVALHFWSLMAVLALACTIPLRPGAAPGPDSR